MTNAADDFEGHKIKAHVVLPGQAPPPPDGLPVFYFQKAADDVPADAEPTSDARVDRLGGAQVPSYSE